MKPPEAIVEYIDRWIADSLDRPHMYASSPSALEDMVSLLDRLRNFILDQATMADAETLEPYTAHLISQGFGSARFTSINQNHDFEAIASFVRQYLITQNRPHIGGYGETMKREN